MGVSSASRGAPPFHLRHPEPLELVHGDICGPMKLATPGGKTLFLLLVDDKSRFMWLVLLQAKSEAAEAIKRIQACTSRGREVTWSSFGKYCDKLDL